MDLKANSPTSLSSLPNVIFGGSRKKFGDTDISIKLYKMKINLGLVQILELMQK